ncbi:hypothetical protein PFDSM3638_05325 [Pyrococcus furiosus DSM 3638]|uniref:Zinc finger ZPR1-type domain-containing protein n=3 Tax=Pyrococcus furiosus TaxID=2261 RepID=A0A5C0XPW8_PYRFU|nr:MULTISPECIES: ZPR1 zinc finger domain-containing protein [Pyrococcus]AAL81184.1 hypothetical protein PF1060 [Pyrococcus furiosus DSM 3638]AFN03856.1 hypothetical protein PFC_04535 [Pyrococcus furiosus COM1]QEK78721.1 hypothetical protein PFDSM3638_05325 [Pyrococcus furiosus DSM 3638]
MEDLRPERIQEIGRTDCPVCKGKNTLKLIQFIHKIPYLGEVMLSTAICDNCGYRDADVMILEAREPKLYEVKVEEEKDLFTRVVRSKSGTIELPELGITIEPGPRAEGFISNIEGVLERVKEVLLMARDFKEQENDEASVKKIDELLRYIEEVKEGKKPLTVRIMDPFGNSALIGEKVKSRRLTKEEIKSLSTGPYYVIDLDELPQQ